jgi:hypothetical protein
MSEAQIHQILKTLEQQDKVLSSIRREQGEVKSELKEYKEKLEPMYKVFASVNGFNAISVWIFKALILLGAGIGVVYGFIKWIRN